MIPENIPDVTSRDGRENEVPWKKNPSPSPLWRSKLIDQNQEAHLGSVIMQVGYQLTVFIHKCDVWFYLLLLVLNKRKRQITLVFILKENFNHSVYDIKLAVMWLQSKYTTEKTLQSVTWTNQKDTSNSPRGRYDVLVFFKLSNHWQYQW